MRSLFAFLWKYQFFVLFVILELLSILMLVNSYSYHKSLAFNSTNDLTGGVLEIQSGITDYFSLKKVNKDLLQENTVLRHQQVSSFLLTDTNVIYRDSLYRYLPARVVSNSVNKQNNFILLNKGSRHGIRKEMGVLSGNGLAGIVTGVSENYTYVMSMLHQNSRISARIKKNGQLVNVVWDGVDPKLGEVIDIPSHIILGEGDTIITSGNSLIFPEEVLIGTIWQQKISQSKDLGTASIIFSTDFNSLRYVYLIDNLMKEEQDKLINDQSDE
jgi:rod shape-determining protein MreC